MKLVHIFITRELIKFLFFFDSRKFLFSIMGNIFIYYFGGHFYLLFWGKFLFINLGDILKKNEWKTKRAFVFWTIKSTKNSIK